jgi:hypothetical protein
MRRYQQRNLVGDRIRAVITRPIRELFPSVSRTCMKSGVIRLKATADSRANSMGLACVRTAIGSVTGSDVS